MKYCRQHSPNQTRPDQSAPVEEKPTPTPENQIVDNRTEDNIVDDILSAEDDYMTMPTQNEILNTYNTQTESAINNENLMQIEFLKDMNQLHSLDDELFYNDIDFESFQNNHIFNMNTNDMDYNTQDRNTEILFDFADPGRSMDQDIMNALYHVKPDHLPDELLNVPEVENFNDTNNRPNELLNPTVSVNECATIFESDVDLEASANLAANLNQLIGENNVQYISTEDDDTFIISLKSEIDAAQLSDMLNMANELADNNKESEELVSASTSDANVETSENLENNIVEPIVLKIEEKTIQPTITINAGVISRHGEETEIKTAKKTKAKKKVLYVCRKCNKVFNKKNNFTSHIGKSHRHDICFLQSNL